MPSSPEQLAAAAKAHFDAQSQLITVLTSKTFEGVEKVIALNVNAAQTAIGELSSAIGSVKGPQALFAASSSRLEPNAEQAFQYGRQLTEIGEGLQAGFAKTAEAQVAETRKALAAMVDEAVKSAPPGSEATIAVLQAVLRNADLGYEKLMKETMKAVETLQSNVKSASEKIAEATEGALKAGRK
jgi:phasin family protein